MGPTSLIKSLIPCLALSYVCVAEQLKVNEISKILNEHNRLRRNVANGKHGFNVANMQKLTWSTSLQDIATNLAHCGRRQRNNTSQFHLEVNIGQVTGKKFRRIIRRWFREILFVIPEFRTCINLEDCKQFQTMTSPEHQYIGCGYNRCNNNRISLACVYEGGILDLPAYKNGLPCTKCKESSSFCDEGLCVKCNPLEENCDCRKTCQKPHIGNGTLDELTCSCTCSYGLGLNCDEECKNPEQYLDFDICAEISQEECNSPFPEDNNILKEFCPEQCLCHKFPEIIDVVPDI